MRRILYLLTILFLGLGLVMVTMVWHELRVPTTPASPVAKPAPSMEQIQRGAYLARVGNCALCHTAAGGAPYAGGKGIPTPFGTVYTSNLTPHAQALGNWKSDDFWIAMHEGRSRDGHLLYPAFPYTSFTDMARDDSDALFAYLQTLPAAENPNREHALRWPYSSQWALAIWRVVNFRPSTTMATAPSAGDAALRGAYLVNGIAHCNECHGARNAWGAPDLRQRLGGATLPQSLWYAPSLRSTLEAGVEAWSVEDTVALLTTGTNGQAVASGPMAEVVHHSTQYLTPDDARAMALYLATLEPAETPRKAATEIPPSVQALGSRIYEAQCAECHGKQGEGRTGAYPALAGNRAVLMTQYQNLALGVLHGGFGPATRGVPQPYGMPPFQLVLNDTELAAVLSYIRNAWGNQASAVSEFDINKFRNLQTP